MSMGGFAARKALQVVRNVEKVCYIKLDYAHNKEIIKNQNHTIFLSPCNLNNILCHFMKVIAIELLAACQAIEFLRPLKTTVPLEECYKVVRSIVR